MPGYVDDEHFNLEESYYSSFRRQARYPEGSQCIDIGRQMRDLDDSRCSELKSQARDREGSRFTNLKRQAKVTDLPKALSRTSCPVGCEIRLDPKQFNHNTARKLSLMKIHVSHLDGFLKKWRRKSTGVVNMPGSVYDYMNAPFGLKTNNIDLTSRSPPLTPISSQSSVTKQGFNNFELTRAFKTNGRFDAKSPTDDTVSVTSLSRHRVLEIDNAFLDNVDDPGHFSIEGVKGHQANFSLNSTRRFIPEDYYRFPMHKNKRLCYKRKEQTNGGLTDRPTNKRSETFDNQYKCHSQDNSVYSRANTFLHQDKGTISTHLPNFRLKTKSDSREILKPRKSSFAYGDTKLPNVKANSAVKNNLQKKNVPNTDVTSDAEVTASTTNLDCSNTVETIVTDFEDGAVEESMPRKRKILARSIMTQTDEYDTE